MMTELEMEGFLRGKCVPGDMLVNESNSQYLVRKFKALEEQRAALAAENAALRDEVICWARECDRITYTHTNKITDANQREAAQDLESEAPATDAFLREVRAQGVESGIKTIFTMMNHQAPAVKDAINVLEKHAAELRQGGAA